MFTPTDFSSFESDPVSVLPQPATQQASPCLGSVVGKHAAATSCLVPMPIDIGVRKSQAS